MTTDQATVGGVNVSRETMEMLQAYTALLRKWSPKINLIARSSLPDIWVRHISDSAQLLPLGPDPVGHWADLGSGGGLPGIVIAILLRDRPTKISLVESDQRKATFLRTCGRELGLTLAIHTTRTESLAPLKADTLSARALAPLPTLLSHVSRHLSPTGIALLPKGKNAAAEIADARKIWAFDLQTYPSQTDSAATILRLERISRA